jgi:hypothetical protein
MAQPNFRRYWLKILPDGSGRPEFEPDTGKYHNWRDYTGPVKKVLLVPVTPDLAQKIKSTGDLAEPSSLPILEYDVEPVRELIDIWDADNLGTPLPSAIYFRRDGRLQYILHYFCSSCRLQFDLDKGSLICPRCQAKNEWYCGKCESIVDRPIVFFDGVQRCPVCEIKGKPHGCRRIKTIVSFYEERLTYWRILEINGNRHILLDLMVRKK